MTLAACLEHQPMHRFGVGWGCGRCGIHLRIDGKPSCHVEKAFNKEWFERRGAMEGDSDPTTGVPGPLICPKCGSGHITTVSGQGLRATCHDCGRSGGDQEFRAGPMTSPKAGSTDGGCDLADEIDPEVGFPSDCLLRRIHLDVETRGRKNPAFAVSVHQRNIVLSAVAHALRKREGTWEEWLEACGWPRGSGSYECYRPGDCDGSCTHPEPDKGGE